MVGSGVTLIVTVSEAAPQLLEAVAVTGPELLAVIVIVEPDMPFDQLTVVPGEGVALRVIWSPAQASTEIGETLMVGGRQKVPE